MNFFDFNKDGKMDAMETAFVLEEFDRIEKEIDGRKADCVEEEEPDGGLDFEDFDTEDIDEDDFESNDFGEDDF